MASLPLTSRIACSESGIRFIAVACLKLKSGRELRSIGRGDSDPYSKRFQGRAASSSFLGCFKLLGAAQSVQNLGWVLPVMRILGMMVSRVEVRELSVPGA